MDRQTFDLPSGVFHALVGGPRDAPPLVFLHGFPDHPPTAVPFLDRLARSYRVVAPWLRGYAPSPPSGPYDLATLSRDVVHLVDALGGPVHLVGHDWGAAITYDVCAHHPAKVRRAVTMALPHLRTFFHAQQRAAQRRASAYTALFQLPGAGYLARVNDFGFIDRLWTKWSPGYRLPDPQRRELHACLAAGWPAPLGYYRAFVWTGGAAKRYRRALRRISVPVLQLHGADDGCVLVSVDDDADLFDQRTRFVIPGAGHFLHVERPEIADRVATWLA